MVFTSKALSKYRDQIKLIGETGKGRSMTEEEMMSSIRHYFNSFKKHEDYEHCADQVKFDVEKAALKLSR